MNQNNEQEVKEKTLQYFDGDELATNVWMSKYALRDLDGNFLEQTPADMHQRLAKEYARIEQKYPNPMGEEEILKLFSNFKQIVPQGSPMSTIGNPFYLQTVGNCYVIDPPEDSYGGILKTDQQLVQIAKRRGGIGFDISNIRPHGQPTKNAARTTDGIGVFMERFSNSCREVAQNGRRGALMLTISVHHPDIHTFVNIKRDLRKVTGANISIRVSDEFMNAVDNNTDFELRFPVDSETPRVTKMVSAKELWDEIVDSAHQSAEPGVLFWDNVIANTPSDAYEEFRTTSTNPCGEIAMGTDSCRLMLVNTFGFVNNAFSPNSSFQWKKFGQVVQKAQRLMDDIIDIEVECIDRILAKIKRDPESQESKQTEIDLWKTFKDNCIRARRTGLGQTGIGDTLAALGIQYGSQDSIKFVEKLYKTIAINAYKASCILAKERGAFPAFSFDKERSNPFIERVINSDDELKDLYYKHGRRNIALTTTAPAGSVSILTQTTSGIEPAYLLEYKRRRKLDSTEPDSMVDYVDDLGDRWQEYDVYHHNYRKWMNVSGKSGIENSPYYGATSNDINWEASVDLQAAAQKWVCHAISKTCNLPADATRELVSDVYFRAWKSGCKGFTIYRDGSRAGVLLSNERQEATTFPQHSAPKRPLILECDIHHTTIQGERWIILIGLMEDKPYEVFGGLSNLVEIPKKYIRGRIEKTSYKSRNGRYDLIFGNNGDSGAVRDIVTVFDNPNHSAITRLISLSLRHGASIKYTVEQLLKDKNSDMFSFVRCISRVLKQYIPDGDQPSEKTCESCNAEDTLIYMEGCVTCKSCGFSKCG